MLCSGRIFLPFFLLFLAGCLASPPLTGELHGQLNWKGLVQIRGDLVLEKDVELIIAPGTRVQFLSPLKGEDRFTEHPNFVGSELIVRGQIHALGTAEAPIRFEAADPLAGPGSWGGINIEDSPQAEFRYCSFRQADSAIHSRTSWVSIEQCRFTENLVGIRFHDTDMLIENNLLADNGAAIRFHFGAPVICNNEIRGNEKGIFITSAPTDYRIENNSLINNRPYQVSLGEGVRNDVDLRHNYWGSVTEKPETLFYDGRIDDWLGRVIYQPKLDRPPARVGVSWGE